MPDGAAFACRNQITTVGNGEHNAGLDCQSGCHNHGFTLSGTISTTNAAVVGASITVKDAAGKTFDMVSQQNGNFYTSQSVTFPVTVIASMCPDVRPMISQLTGPSQGGCNKVGCHVAGAAGPIVLP